MVDYYVLRKQEIKNLDVFYDEKGPLKGVNWAGIIAIAVGSAFAFIDVRLSWYASLTPAAVTYLLLMKSMPGCKLFLDA